MVICYHDNDDLHGTVHVRNLLLWDQYREDEKIRKLRTMEGQTWRQQSRKYRYTQIVHAILTLIALFYCIALL